MREITTDPTGVSRASVELDLMWQPGLISEAVVSVVLFSNEGAHIVNIIWRLLLGRLRFLTFRHLI